MTPGKFTNVTNGIAYRRWLCQANPKLSELIGELCGTDFLRDSSQLEQLLKYKEDTGVLNNWRKLKKITKYGWLITLKPIIILL
jgi:starch phosphorylase